jgi:phenylpyruvate tautomerase
LDNINPEANAKYSEAFFTFFKDVPFEIPGDRGYITFVDPGRAYLG